PHSALRAESRSSCVSPDCAHRSRIDDQESNPFVMSGLRSGARSANVSQRPQILVVLLVDADPRSDSVSFAIAADAGKLLRQEVGGPWPGPRTRLGDRLAGR